MQYLLFETKKRGISGVRVIELRSYRGFINIGVHVAFMDAD